MMDNWKELFRAHILERGWGYYEAGAVKQVTAVECGFEAVVEGSEDYEVEIEVQDGEVGDMWCSCPYAADGNYCKHMAAVLYEIEEGGKGDSFAGAVENWAKKYDEEKQELKDVILGIPESEVRNILFELAASNELLKNRILMEYTENITEKQMLRMKKEIEGIAWQNSDRRGFVDWNHAGDYASAVIGFLHDNVGKMIEKGFTMEAFELTNAVFIQTGNLAMDDSGGESTWIANVCYEYWQDILDHCGEEERKKMLGWFREKQSAGVVVDYMEDYLSEFLMNEFHDEEMLREKLAMLDEEIERAEGQSDCGGSWSVHYGYENNIVKRLEIMKELGCTKEEMQEYRRKNWNFASVRMMQISEYQEEGRIEEAIELLEESKKLDEKVPGLVAEYSGRLVELYHDLGKMDEYKRELIFFIFRCRQGRMEYVDKLKEICSKKEWEDYREKLLSGESEWSIRYELMVKEELYERLLEGISKEDGVYYLDRYEKVLKEEFPEQVRDVYVQYVTRQAERAADRSRYKELVQYLKKIRKYPDGDKAAGEIAAEWKEKYRRRPAMMDELRKANF